jgi:hypothetical protein
MENVKKLADIGTVADSTAITGNGTTARDIPSFFGMRIGLLNRAQSAQRFTWMARDSSSLNSCLTHGVVVPFISKTWKVGM